MGLLDTSILAAIFPDTESFDAISVFFATTKLHKQRKLILFFQCKG
jgi:hypothetical protein